MTISLVSDIYTQVKSCVTDKHNTKYNTLVSELPYIHARWSIFTFRGQNEPRPGHGTPWVNSGTIPAIPGRLASLLKGPDKFVYCLLTQYIATALLHVVSMFGPLEPAYPREAFHNS